MKYQVNFKNTNYVVTSDCSNLYNSLEKQLLSVSVGASNWFRYTSGIFSNCNNASINYAVLAVGAS